MHEDIQCEAQRLYLIKQWQLMKKNSLEAITNRLKIAMKVRTVVHLIIQAYGTMEVTTLYQVIGSCLAHH